MSNHTLHGMLAIALAAFGLLGPSSASQPAPLAGSTRLGSGPVAGPIEVFTDAEVLSGPGGSLLETTVVVANDGVEPASVLLIGRIEWPDGSTQLLHYGPPSTVDADGALIITALSPIPADVGSGEGSFTVTAIVAAIGQGGHADYAGRLIAQDSSPFVLP